MKRWIDYWKDVRQRVTWDRSLLRALWVVPVLHIKGRLRRTGKPFAKMAFYPHPAAPFYTMRLALSGTGIRTSRHIKTADIIMMFDDRTQSDAPPPVTDAHILNARALDISKSHVGKVFEAVFGYALSVDPSVHVGPMVEKSETNGVHDGRIVQAPLASPDPDSVYQVLVNSTVDEGITEDLRCVCVGGQVVQVFRKEKATEARFSTTYLGTTLVDAETVFEPEELDRIAHFCQIIGLDFGSIDVLRDHIGTGRIYIVDVNKTCMPVLSMPVAELNIALTRIGAAVERFVETSESMPVLRPSLPVQGVRFVSEAAE